MSDKYTSTMPIKSRDWTWLGYPTLVILLLVSMLLIRKTDGIKTPDWQEDRLTYLPSGKILKPMVMDLDEAAADILWIDGMIYFADAYLEKKSYRWMGHILDVVTQLNPRFHEAYEFGGSVLGKEKSQLPSTLRLLNRGLEEFPQDWRLHLYAAMAQLALDSNFIKAGEYLKPVALVDDVPPHIRTLCASLLNKGGGKHIALAFLVDSYVKANDPIKREIFLEKILKLYPANPEKDKLRIETTTRVLHEVILEPMAEMVALGVLHEFLSDSLSQQGKNLLELLYR